MIQTFSPSETLWHKRWHPLRETWVVYAAHRNQRPWTVGKQAIVHAHSKPYDPDCYLCAGNARVGGIRNPDYKGIYIFENDHPVVGPLAPEVVSGSGIYRKARAGGVAKVICYSSRHDLTTSDMDPDALVQIFQAWRAETQAMAALSGIRNLLIFENKGEMVGVSNPHPHGQLYATDFTFTLNRMYMDAARRHYQETSRDLFAEIVHEEQEFGGRILAENENALAFVPFFARYAYETLIFPKRKHLTMATLSDTELQDLAEVYATVIRKMDGLFGISFPYVMTINQAPFELDYPSLYQLHWQFLPPLRQPDLKKFPAGPEIGGDTFMADTVPEEKARELQAVSVSLRQN